MAPGTSLDVFISFSRQDMEKANKVCEALEAKGIRCWIAHRDIVPGSGYLGAVLEAADHCRAAVVIISSNTSSSNFYVLDRAATRGVPIVWVVIGSLKPPDEFNRFKDSALVIDASTRPLDSYLPSLAVQVNSLLNSNRMEAWQGTADPVADGSFNPERGAEDDLSNKLILSNGQDAPLAANFPSGGIDDNAIEIALRTTAQVFSEMRSVTRGGAGNSNHVSPSRARSDTAHPGVRLISFNSRPKPAKRHVAFIFAGLAVIAFGAGAIFSAQIIRLLNMIAEYVRYVDLG